ncbi:hypothetical protein VMUT_1021 [Vulcanisaeta moutnovskia 768-28]|uniref:Piwi domain-containing protein n=1 Tax=Vulcanisaeta moutnovskia (strain 768-28) TaxID=985053 RepID=F0QXR5_VULM7|nr:hypothetical protein [Vulcanisaeta moutnovskia]ADY01228.1 hypothetical protein VMUT_1021 [Vulcanisaeta moutnovskia 768-28]
MPFNSNLIFVKLDDLKRAFLEGVHSGHAVVYEVSEGLSTEDLKKRLIKASVMYHYRYGRNVFVFGVKEGTKVDDLVPGRRLGEHEVKEVLKGIPSNNLVSMMSAMLNYQLSVLLTSKGFQYSYEEMRRGKYLCVSNYYGKLIRNPVKVCLKVNVIRSLIDEQDQYLPIALNYRVKKSRRLSPEVMNEIHAEFMEAFPSYLNDLKIITRVLNDDMVRNRELKFLEIEYKPPAIITFRFRGNSTGENVTDILKLGPYFLPGEEEKIDVVFVYENALASQAKKLTKVLEDTIKDGLGIKLNIDDEHKFSHDKPLGDVIKLVRDRFINSGSCLLVLSKENRLGPIFMSIKPLTLKKNFYFKSQFITNETISKLDSYAVKANIVNSILFRVEGTPYMPVLRGNIDVLANNLFVGIALSKPLRKGYTKGGIALIDPYSARIITRAIVLKRKMRSGKFEASDMHEIVSNIKGVLKDYKELYNVNELVIHISKFLSDDEYGLFYEYLQDLNVNVRLLSIRKRDDITLVRDGRMDSLTMIKRGKSHVEVMYWPHERAYHPLTIRIYGDNVDRDVMMRHLRFIELLRHMYYPASSRFIVEPATISYSRRVARFAPWLSDNT